MAEANKLVAAIKVGGKILRETSNVVSLPFSSEYSIYLKNLNSVRALVRVSIDGVDATEGVWLIIEANSTLELERFIRDGNFNKGNKLKFIERTPQIEEYKGIGIDDGRVRVEYKFEVPQPVYSYNNPIITYSGIAGNGTLGGLNQQWGQTTCFNSSSSEEGTTFTSSTNCATPPSPSLKSRGLKERIQSLSKQGGPQGSSRGLRCNSAFRGGGEALSFEETSLNDAGITVPGSESNQKFTSGAWFPTETTSHVIVLKLVGKVQGEKIVKPITVKVKPTCVTCGRLNKATHKFCGSCGTALQLF